MPSALSAGPLFKYLRVSRALNILKTGVLDVNAEANLNVNGTETVNSGGRLIVASGGRFRIAGQAAPATPVLGDMYVTTAGVLMIHNGTAFVAVGSQV